MTKHIQQLQAYALKNTTLNRSDKLLTTEAYNNRSGEFDFKSLFYDIVSTDSATLLYCPKLLNLEKLINESEFYIDDTKKKISIKKFSRYDVIKIKNSGNKLTIKNQYFNESWNIQKFDSSRFKSKNCIVTVIKNDKLSWIKDFVKFHIKHHQLDAIVIYDNGSTEYTQQELEKCLSATGISDFFNCGCRLFRMGQFLRIAIRHLCFLQTALLNLAKIKFFPEANAVLSIDIDELVWSGTKTIFHITQSSLFGFILFSGAWRFSNTASTHESHQYVDDLLPSCPTKYCYAPNKVARWLELGVHRIYFKRSHIRNLINFLLLSKIAGYWHCRSISTSWKGVRAMSNNNLKVDKLFIKHFS